MIEDYISENIKLLYGDCLERMKEIPDKSVDMILCDLPYGMTACKWDTIIPFEPLWKEYNRIIKRNGAILLFGQEPFSSLVRMSNFKNYKYDWYWQKERITNIFQIKKRPGKVIENIMVFYKKQPVYNPQMTIYNGRKVTNKVKQGKLGSLIDSGNKKPFEYQDNGTRYPIQILKFNRDILTCNLHKTQKPVELLSYLIRTFTDENETVLDNCMGSASTGVACINTNRKFIGIELNETYFNIARERILKERNNGE